tara:strand:+ start:1136 stop:1369 length:234 start_codon:yes stop_codon:yes gene_type:complete
MRVLALWKLYRQFNKLHTTIKETDVKKFWRSKTIMFQLLTILAAVTGVVPLPADVTAAIVGCLNVGLRLLTSEGLTT